MSNRLIFDRSPDGGKGLARDTRVRWALEEVGLPYEVRLVSFQALKEPAHLALNPFGQIPTYEEGDLALFETGAIVFHIAEHHPGLLPADAHARARVGVLYFGKGAAPLPEEGFRAFPKAKQRADARRASAPLCSNLCQLSARVVRFHKPAPITTRITPQTAIHHKSFSGESAPVVGN